jgi:transcription elongation factor GreA-like protein
MNLIKSLSDDFEKYYMANSVLGIIASSCLGSIAAMMILADGNTVFHVVHLGWIVIVCMVYNAAVLVGFKPKMAFLLQVISVLSSLFTIAYYIFF